MQSYNAAFNAALPTFVANRDINCEWKTLSNRGRLLAQQNQTAAAIASYQQAIEMTTKIWRDSVSWLSPQQQQSYHQRIQPIYHELALLLVEQGRLAEVESLLNQIEN